MQIPTKFFPPTPRSVLFGYIREAAESTGSRDPEVLAPIAIDRLSREAAVKIQVLAEKSQLAFDDYIRKVVKWVFIWDAIPYDEDDGLAESCPDIF